MIFLTVGTQLPFDRLVEAVDSWAINSKLKVFAQVGPSSQNFLNIECVNFLEPEHFNVCFSKAEIIVAHAGMGSILSALSFAKPIIIMPRVVENFEHRNNHQMGTARYFENHNSVHVAWNSDELIDLLVSYERSPFIFKSEKSKNASSSMLNNLKLLIDSL